MSRTLLIAAAAFALPASAALAQAVPATPGALAGRSPHVSYRTASTPTATCGKTMHSVPAGKLPVHGLHALPKAPCATVTLAQADDQSRTARD